MTDAKHSSFQLCTRKEALAGLLMLTVALPCVQHIAWALAQIIGFGFGSISLKDYVWIWVSSAGVVGGIFLFCLVCWDEMQKD